MQLTTQEILAVQKNKYPFLMIDIVTDLVLYKSVTGYKNLTVNDWFFECHWPGDPNMPGMLQIEAIVQLGALTVLCDPNHADDVMYLHSANNLSFKRKVVPGDRLDLECVVKSFKNGILNMQGNSYVGNQAAASAEFTLISKKYLDKFRGRVDSK